DADLDQLLETRVHAVALDERDQRLDPRAGRAVVADRADRHDGLAGGHRGDRRGRALFAGDQLDRVADPRPADPAEVVVLVAGDRELAGRQCLDEDPDHRASTADDHCGSTVLGRILTIVRPAAANSSASGCACEASKPDRISVPPVSAHRRGRSARSTWAWMFASTSGNGP